MISVQPFLFFPNWRKSFYEIDYDEYVTEDSNSLYVKGNKKYKPFLVDC